MRSPPPLQVLLGQRFHGVFFSAGVMDVINDAFMLHDCSTQALVRGLQVRQRAPPSEGCTRLQPRSNSLP
jgi:hypothetical protein